jgi:TMEM175 potassium channel family protein
MAAEPEAGHEVGPDAALRGRGSGGSAGGVGGVGVGMSVGRLEAFSDGVLAIVITLLILEIHVPAPEGPDGARGELGSRLLQEWPHYLSYLLSFLIVGIIWLNHHAMFNLLQRTDHKIRVLNLLLLLPITVLPWPTDLLATYAKDGTAADQRLAVLIYGMTSSAMAVAFNVLWRYLRRHPELHKPHVTPELLAVRNSRYNVGLAAYPIATLLGLLSVPLFLGLMLALALLYLLPTPDVG